MKFRFTAEHFPFSTRIKLTSAQSHADQANALLEAEEAKCERVYGPQSFHGFQSTTQNSYHTFRNPGHTHTALLWNVEKIEREK